MLSVISDFSRNTIFKVIYKIVMHIKANHICEKVIGISDRIAKRLSK
jgi:hypothetical protein